MATLNVAALGLAGTGYILDFGGGGDVTLSVLGASTLNATAVPSFTMPRAGTITGFILIPIGNQTRFVNQTFFLQGNEDDTYQ